MRSRESMLFLARALLPAGSCFPISFSRCQMKHIEHHPEPLNPFPSREATLRRAALAVLKSSFGKFWPVYLLLLLLVVFGPTIYFWHEIRLEPAEFVTEWLKLSIEGVLLFFILEIVRHRSLSANARELLLNSLTANYILPLQEVTASLKGFRDSLVAHDQVESGRFILRARANWRLLEHALSNDFLSRLPAETGAGPWLLKSRDALNAERCGNILKSMATVRDPEHLNVGEFDDLAGRLEKFLDDVRSL